MSNTDHYFLACQPVSTIIDNIGTQVRIQRRVRTLICESPLPIERLCTVIEKYKIEQITALMWTLLELARSSVVDRFDMSSLKFILSGGQHVPDTVQETIKQRLGTDLVSIHGGTEAWIVSSRSLGDEVPKEGMKLDGGAKFLARLPLTKSEKLDRMRLRLQAEVEVE
ncbi:hypothetical protein O0I10_002348 [Lichtheimia ornata]|uniref:AMP-dependent synthetase/ligase domain-containing protein n=1 Tax=Lichtheimia ornata TaxID=688661 RepID=A0AAD7Y2R6_9FUNG|nr:uncharacterized protein O0I10_002348 [Lichtheimia ornata]KAJ8662017.1 hypothetical protein O0I10_002348 [Lichtheimia ornata]